MTVWSIIITLHILTTYRNDLMVCSVACIMFTITCYRKMSLYTVYIQNGHTPLLWAANNGHVSTVVVLVDAGADVTIPENVSSN